MATKSVLVIDEEVIQRVFESTGARKRPGPDNMCLETLFHSGVFCSLFQRSLDTLEIPSLWKKSTVVPVPKTSHASVSNDYRPVALTSLLMKSLEKIIKAYIINTIRHLLDPLQFAYRSERGTDDAILSLLHLVYMHLEGSKTHVPIRFADFSSAFNTINPLDLADRLKGDFGLMLCLSHGSPTS